MTNIELCVKMRLYKLTKHKDIKKKNLAYQLKILLLHPSLQVAFQIVVHEVVAFQVSYQLFSLLPEAADQVFFQHVLFLKW